MGQGLQSSIPGIEGTAHFSSHPCAPTQRREYDFDMDASDMALGTMLQEEQDGQLRIIGYASHALTNAERCYCITCKELLGVVYGLKKYRQGQPIVVRTDHAILVS